MRRQNLANDVIAVLKKDGKSLDYAEGVMGDISDDKIEFKLDGETQRVDRAKIAGAIYYRPDRRMKEEPKASIQGRSGLRVSAAHVEFKDSLLELTTAAGVKLTWPVERHLAGRLLRRQADVSERHRTGLRKMDALRRPAPIGNPRRRIRPTAPR